MTRFHLIMFCLVLHAEVTRSLLIVTVRLSFGFNCQNLYHIGMDVATGVTGWLPYRYPTPLIDPVNY